MIVAGLGLHFWIGATKISKIQDIWVAVAWAGLWLGLGQRSGLAFVLGLVYVIMAPLKNYFMPVSRTHLGPRPPSRLFGFQPNNCIFWNFENFSVSH